MRNQSTQTPESTACAFSVRWIALTCALWAAYALCLRPLAAQPDATGEPLRELVRFDASFDPANVVVRDARVAVESQGTLTITTSGRAAGGEPGARPGIELRPAAGTWDFTETQFILFTLKNRGSRAAVVAYSIPGMTDPLRVTLLSGDEKPCFLRIYPTRWKFDRPVTLHGFIQAAPGAPPMVDPARVTGLRLEILNTRESHTLGLGPVHAGGTMRTLKADHFFPFVDEFGQNRHEDWPGKIKEIGSFSRQREAEAADLAAHPSPQDRNAYGGWTKGPQLKATGFFRVEKHQGKWWLVDPEGRLFWSIGLVMTRAANDGPDALVNRNVTPLSGREHYFEKLPPPDSPFAQFFGTGHWAPRGYYAGRTPYRTYSFAQANLLRKYGESWRAVYDELVHRRFRSWGLNTLAHRTDKSILELRKTPYVASIEFEDVKFIEGSQGFWTKFYDVFDPSFQAALRRALEAEKRVSIDDRWCLGFFVNHEVAWGDSEIALALATLISPPTQPAKAEFISNLRRRYDSIDALNAKWGSALRSWDELAAVRFEPDVRKAGDDLLEFSRLIADTYFRTVRDEMRRFAPNQLYLGCRFANRNAMVVAAAARYADVVSMNTYDYTVENLRLPGDIDRPILIGEFHFGAQDRGLFYPSLMVMALDQNDRAVKFTRFVEGALRNPQMIGVHWFQYRDEPTAGRGDGENYQCGFVTETDTPYPEIIGASRTIGERLYSERMR